MGVHHPHFQQAMSQDAQGAPVRSVSHSVTATEALPNKKAAPVKGRLFGVPWSPAAAGAQEQKCSNCSCLAGRPRRALACIVRHKRLACAGTWFGKSRLAGSRKIAARCACTFLARGKAGTWAVVVESRLARAKAFTVTARGKTSVFARGTKATTKSTTTLRTVVRTALHTLAVIETAGTTKVALTVTTKTSPVAAEAATCTGATATKLAITREVVVATTATHVAART